MPSPPTIEIDALLAPIPGGDPAGSGIPYVMRTELEEARKEVDPNEYDENDPMRPTEFVRADWAGIAKRTQDALKNTSKDLLLAARLLEALTKLHGFAGLRDGLRLMHRMVSECWDRLQPPLEDDDAIEIRAAPFHWIEEVDRGARFPTTVRQVPVAIGDEGPLSWQHWRQSQDGRGNITKEVFEKAIANTPREMVQNAADDLAETQQEFLQLQSLLNEKMGSESPAFTGLRGSIGETAMLVGQILERKGPDPNAVLVPSEEDDPAADDGSSAGGGGLVRGKPRNRREVYQQLAEIASLLQEMEPHSPIPYLIQRAVELGGMPFPRLIQELVRDGGVIEEMNRELGIKDETE